ncbi:membrane protein insertase YidC [Magnetovirga frankeli]|uniref:membrane protein insertase YidC n=1 Tax=Magnetovirga frankeli TaxID=947516 RepID=UPI001292EE5A|nr:membrane protein insertase YidC [gamma proteobacterium SS-5]
MDNYRLILIVSLAFLSVMLWSSWQNDYNNSVSAQVGNQANPVKPTGSDIPEARVEPQGNTSLPSESKESTQNNTKGERILVRTDVLSLELDTQGGTIKELDLLEYPLSPENDDIPFRLMSDNPNNYFIAQSGLLSDESVDVPNHKKTYRAEKRDYALAENSDELSVLLRWKSDNLEVEKIYEFQRGSYEIKLIHRIKNLSSSDLPIRDYRQFMRGNNSMSQESAFIYTYTGGAIFSPEEKFSKLDFDELAKETLSKDVTGGWIAMMQHYFLGAFIPDHDKPQHFYSKKASDERFILGLYSASKNLAPGESAEFTGRMWLGPKLQEHLEDVAPGLELTTDYGWLTVIAKPLFWILKSIHDLVGNWGWAIVLLTVLIKLAFYRLSAASYRSMAGMRQLAPRLQQIKERYGDDKEKFNKAMMELYQKEKINPVGGCLPILVQIPVFIALYWVLLESVELRNAPFILWIDNLSVKDPYYILPLVMGVSMYIQQKLNPAPPDPLQAKIMMSLPFIFTVFFAFFPSGLVLYWVVNNLLSILQQWRITKLIEAKGN